MSDDESASSLESSNSDIEVPTLRPRREKALPQKLRKTDLELEELHFDMTSKSPFTV